MEENKKAEQELRPEIIPEKITAVNKPEETGIPETESIKAEENPEPVDLKLSTEETMEVHHHAHVHEKKKWKEYIFQFFMLFLAVFCGFLAEYQLEHLIEKNREKQYMSSFIHDLKNDTLNLYEGFPRKDLRIKTIDSIFLFFDPEPIFIGEASAGNTNFWRS